MSEKRLPQMNNDLESLVGYNLKRAYVVIQSDFRRTLQQDNLSARLFSALALALQNPGISQILLARLMGIERSGVVAMVDDLESRGYTTRKPVPNDRRKQTLRVTTLGAESYKVALEKVKDHEARLLCDLSNAETKTLLSILHKIREQEL